MIAKNSGSNCRIKQNKAGIAIVEFALVALLLIFLLLATFDFGLYAYAFISIQNAARVASLRNSGGPESASDQAGACRLVLEEMRGLPNVSPTFQSSCTASPLVVASIPCDNSVPCAGSGTSADGQKATAVTITYTMPALFRIPLVGPNKITRITQMKIRNMP